MVFHLNKDLKIVPKVLIQFLSSLKYNMTVSMELLNQQSES